MAVFSVASFSSETVNESKSIMMRENMLVTRFEPLKHSKGPH